ncbi:hypothetical protein CRG98_040683 [Punica granatum]|uniref:Transposase MuDR plant domain-containing protein n=1 Tax=Punica granatum TaxID=22663 RepID=A0A2I0I4M0_PUNGR|nr:hypothetical protein CRG98_040683 [Punica granatum]
MEDENQKFVCIPRDPILQTFDLAINNFESDLNARYLISVLEDQTKLHLYYEYGQVDDPLKLNEEKIRELERVEDERREQEAELKRKQEEIERMEQEAAEEKRQEVAEKRRQEEEMERMRPQVMMLRIFQWMSSYLMVMKVKIWNHWLGIQMRDKISFQCTVLMPTKNLEITIGMEFKNVEVFKMAVRTMNIAMGREVDFMKNDKARLRAYCVKKKGKDVYQWKIYCGLNKKTNTYQVMIYDLLHTCARRIENKLATKERDAEKLIPILRTQPDMSA